MGKTHVPETGILTETRKLDMTEDHQGEGHQEGREKRRNIRTWTDEDQKRECHLVMDTEMYCDQRELEKSGGL